MTTYSDGTTSGYADETLEEASERAHFEHGHRHRVRELLIAGGFLKVLARSAEEIENHRAQWRSA